MTRMYTIFVMAYGSIEIDIDLTEDEAHGVEKLVAAVEAKRRVSYEPEIVMTQATTKSGET